MPVFGNAIGETCSSPGTGTFSLAGAIAGTVTYKTFASQITTGSIVLYKATNDTGSIFEIGWGSFSDSAPDTITRNVLTSSTGSTINFSGTVYVFNIASGEFLDGLANGGLTTTVHPWAPVGWRWNDYTLGLTTAWVAKTKIGASAHAERGRYYISPAIFVASPNSFWVDKGGAGYTVTTADIGKTFGFDVTAANRTATLPSGATVGHGFVVRVYGYGSTTNKVTITPNGADVCDIAAAAPNRIVRLEWDGALSKWRSDASPSFVGNVRLEGNLAVTGDPTISGTTYFGTANATPGSGDTDAGASIAANGTAHFSAASGSYVVSIGRNDDGLGAVFQHNGSAVGSTSITALGTAFNTTSDRRKKKNWRKIADAIELVERFHFYEGEFTDGPGWGFYVLADEAQKVVPMAVTGEPDAVWGDDGPRDKDGDLIHPVGSPRHQQVDYSKFVVPIGAGLQAAIELIEDLGRRVADLEKR